VHPDVIMSRPKETGFFFEQYHRGTEWLASHYPHYDGERAVGEGSASTMYYPEAARNIRETVPEAKLIFLLRNPIERAYSHYYYDLRCGRIQPSLSFQDIIAHPEETGHRDVVEMGFYDRQLARFDDHFDGEQMLVLLSEDLKKATEETVREVLSFIGVDPESGPSTFERHNVTRHIRYRSLYSVLRSLWQPVRSAAEKILPEGGEKIRARVRRMLSQSERPPMGEGEREYLRDVYSDTVGALEQRLERDLSHWQ
jgi:hypothetical protein